MKTGMLLICVTLLFLFGCCDQTFILHRGGKIPVDTGKNVHEYHHIYKETTYVPQPQVETKLQPETPLSNSGVGTLKDDHRKTTTLENPDNRMISFEITADYPAGTLKPDSILMNGKEASQDNYYDTNSYEYIVQKSGYYRLEGRVAASDKDETISLQMLCKPRELRLNVTDEKTSEKVACEVFLQSQKVSDGSKLKPGLRYLKIQAQGYQSYEDSNFVLPVGEGVYEITKSLTPVQQKIVVVKPEVVPPQAKIVLELKITGDYPKGEQIFPETVMISEKEMGSGDTIAPGQHNLVIRYPGYEVYQSKINVPSGVSPYVLQAELVSLPRTVETLINYDVYPSQAQSSKLGACQVYLQKEDASERVLVSTGDKVKPGQYELLVRRPAYSEIQEKIRIWPSSNAYKIQKTMEAKHRVVQAEVDFDIAPPQYLESHVIDFIDIDTKVPRAVRPGGSIKPGKYNYIVNKPGYQMVGGAKPINIEPDESPFGINETLEALPRQLTFDATYQGKLILAKEILVNGKLTQYENRYAPGKYRIGAKFAEYQTIAQDIEVIPGVGPFVVKLTLVKK